MTLKSCKIEDYNLKLSKPFEYYTASLDYLPYSLVTLSTDDGLVGYGEAALSWDVTGETQEGASAIFQYFLPILMGKKIKSLADIESVMQEINLSVNFNTALKSAVEMALLDLLAKHKKIPVYKLFIAKDAVNIKAQKVFSYGEEDFSKIAPELEETVATDSVIKIKVGKNFENELSFISRIDQFNKKIKIVLDVNQGWENFETSIVNIKKLDQYNILWIEQPVSQDSIDTLAKLKKKSKIKIMADESCHNLVQLKALVAGNAVDYINIKIAKTGGFFEALKMIEYCKKNKVGFVLGDMLCSDLGTVANLHLAQLANFASFDITDPTRITNSKFEGIKNKGNIFIVPNQSGLGVKLT